MQIKNAAKLYSRVGTPEKTAGDALFSASLSVLDVAYDPIRVHNPPRK